MSLIRFLVTTVEGETSVFAEENLPLLDMTEEDVKQIFGENAYWLALQLRDATFRDQQKVLRESAGDDSLLPQKRFLAAVASWTKQVVTQDAKQDMPVTEEAFLNLPPSIGNAVHNAILASWYPNSARTLDFFTKSRQSPNASAPVSSSP